MGCAPMFQGGSVFWSQAVDTLCWGNTHCRLRLVWGGDPEVQKKNLPLYSVLNHVKPLLEFQRHVSPLGSLGVPRGAAPASPVPVQGVSLEC